MNTNQIHSNFKAATQFLISGQLKNAFEKTNLFVQELQIGQYVDKLEDLQLNYRYLIQYFVSGVDDPQRKLVYNKLIAKCFVLNSELQEELLLRNSSNFEYTQKRYFPHTKGHISANELYNALNYYHNQTNFFLDDKNNHEIELKRLRSNFEANLPELFGWFWLSSNYQADEKKLFSQLMSNDYPGWIEKSLVVSALTLNLWRMFDESKLLLLFDCFESNNQVVKQRTLVGLCIILAKYNRFIPFFPSIRNRLVLLIDDSHTLENFQNIFIQLISTADTEKISKKMQEEILPEMLKISPLLKNKMDTENLANNDEWQEENPEWQDILDKSGISEKLQELTELQLEGADVYMSTFAMLKSFPFFSQFCNWFLPFDGNHSSVNELFKSDDKTLLTAFVGNNVMCNSDKYSFCLSILQMPESQRAMLNKSFIMEAEQLDEMSKDEAILKPDLAAKNLSKQYIQDLFRFFKLHPQHSEFKDMFITSLSMHRTFLFDIIANESNLISNISEYYFSKNHYKQALELFQKNLERTVPTASLYQKIGYSFQQISQISNALDAYLKADIIQPDDSWTVKKIALCYRLTGDYTKALEYYKHTDFLKPNQQSVLLQIANCYFELNKFKEALNIYLKIDAESDENYNIWRAIAWCSFVSGNLPQSDYYLTKILELDIALSQDFLNAGHVALCQQKINESISFYQKSLKLDENNWDLFVDNFNNDKKYLLNNGVKTDDIPLILDVINPLSI